MSLREEIFELMSNALYRSIDSGYREFYTNEILQVIEKRIDEMIQENSAISSQDTYTTTSLYGGRIALEKVKEMLQ